MPISFSVRATRIAISPRFAIRIFSNTAAQSIEMVRRRRPLQPSFFCSVTL
jgi:hypothetical protein